jgi:hypothetical protein
MTSAARTSFLPFAIAAVLSSAVLLGATLSHAETTSRSPVVLSADIATK